MCTDQKGLIVRVKWYRDVGEKKFLKEEWFHLTCVNYQEQIWFKHVMVEQSDGTELEVKDTKVVIKELDQEFYELTCILCK